MISDVLSQAVQDIEWYLNEPVYDRMYEGGLRKRIASLVTEMDKIRRELDMPPTAAEIDEMRSDPPPPTELDKVLYNIQGKTTEESDDPPPAS